MRTLNHKITWPALIFLVIYCVPLVVWPDESLETLNSVFNGIVSYGGALYIVFSIVALAASWYFAFSRYGKVVLGDPGSKPRFGWGAYVSIIVAMGIGSTIMRTATITWAPIAMAPPFGVEPLTPEAMAVGNAYSMYLWSFQTFAIFSVGAPAIAYLLFVRKTPVLRMSEIYRCLFGDRFVDGIGGKLVDITFLVAIVGGAAAFLGLGTPIVTGIAAKLMGLEPTFGLTAAVTLVWIALFTTSVMLGLEKGIKILSELNMYVAGLFGLLILVTGPTTFILALSTNSLAELAQHFLSFALNIGTEPPATEGAFDIQRYTVFWCAYNATWSLLHSIFAAKISEGRTVRELLLTYQLAPLGLAWIATGLLGGLGAGAHASGSLDVVAALGELGQMGTVAEIIGTLPLGLMAMIVFAVLTMIFFATTLDSTTFTVAAYTDTGDMHSRDPGRGIRLFWAAVISVMALVLLRIGGLTPLEVTTGLLGIPIIFIQLSAVYAAKKMMDRDQAWETNIRKPPPGSSV